MNTVFTVVKYEEKIENRITTKLFENKSISLDAIMTVCKNNGYDMMVITRDIVLVKAISDFYADGRKKYRYWTFFTQEACLTSLTGQLSFRPGQRCP